MVERTVTLCKQLGAGTDREEILPVLARAACEQLRLRLRSGVTEADCGDVFPLAAAMLVLDTLSELDGESAVTAFTAGEVSIRKENGTSGSLVRAARQMMAPWSREDGFAFLGVEG